MNVVFLQEARIEFVDAVTYYEMQQDGLGDRFAEAVQEAVSKISQSPLRFIEIEPGLRRCRVRRFPYGLVYYPLQDEIQIIAVMHLHRRPGYWRERS